MELDKWKCAGSQDVVVATIDVKIEVGPAPEVVGGRAVGNVPVAKKLNLRKSTRRHYTVVINSPGSPIRVSSLSQLLAEDI